MDVELCQVVRIRFGTGRIRDDVVKGTVPDALDYVDLMRARPDVWAVDLWERDALMTPEQQIERARSTKDGDPDTVRYLVPISIVEMKLLNETVIGAGLVNELRWVVERFNQAVQEERIE